MIVVVYTSDGYWIGADSARSSQGKRVETVCKIHATRFGVVVKSGNTQGTHLSGETYSTDEEVKSILDSSRDSEEFEAHLRSAFKSDVDDELSYVLNNPNVNGGNIETTPMLASIPESLVLWLQRDVSLFPNGDPRSGVLLEVRPQSDPILIRTPFGPRTMYKYWAPARFSWHSIDDLRSPITLDDGRTISYPDSVRMLTYPVEYDKPDSWVRTHPKQALIEMLTLGSKDESGLIGPPFEIVHVSVDKKGNSHNHWILRGKCPSWSTDIETPSLLESVRNPPASR